MKNNWKDKLKEELYQFDVSSIQVTVLEYFIESLLEEQKKELMESFLKVVEEDITRNQERGFPTSAVAKQWILTQLKHYD